MKRQKIDEGKGEWHLPQPLIQHILSYLSINDAARMRLLSKTWYSAWYTHPILNLDLDDNKIARAKDNRYSSVFVDRVREQFMKYANKSLQRYRNQKVNIEQINLSMRCLSCHCSYFIRKLFDNIEKSGVIIQGLGVSFTLCGPRYSHPDLFRILQYKALRELNASECSLRKKFGYKEIKCCLLRRLFLKHADIDKATLQGLISRCPLIESLKLVCCRGLDGNKAFNLHWLKECVIDDKLTGQILHEESKDSGVEVEEPNGPLKLHLCKNLKKLLLDVLPIEDSYFENLDDKFPYLEDLSIENCYGYEKMNISSSKSLKSISLTSLRGIKDHEINAPGLVSFAYEGNRIPCFNSSGIPSSKCKCDIRIVVNLNHDELPVDALWFFQLKETLSQLMDSTILLAVSFCSIDHIDFQILGDEPRVQVESLTIDIWQEPKTSLKYSTLITNLFWTCQPKTICVDGSDKKLVKFLCTRLMESRNTDERKSLLEYKFWENDLKEVEIQTVNKEDGKEGQFVPLGWRYLVNWSYSELLSNPMKIFRLKW